MVKTVFTTSIYTFFSRFSVQRESFVINIFGEVSIGLWSITNYPYSVPIFCSLKKIENSAVNSMTFNCGKRNSSSKCYFLSIVITKKLSYVAACVCDVLMRKLIGYVFQLTLMTDCFIW